MSDVFINPLRDLDGYSFVGLIVVKVSGIFNGVPKLQVYSTSKSKSFESE